MILAFDSVEDARRWYDSAEYGATRPLRVRCGHPTVLLVEG